MGLTVPLELYLQGRFRASPDFYRAQKDKTSAGLCAWPIAQENRWYLCHGPLWDLSGPCWETSMYLWCHIVLCCIPEEWPLNCHHLYEVRGPNSSFSHFLPLHLKGTLWASGMPKPQRSFQRKTEAGQAGQFCASGSRFASPAWAAQ